MRKTIYINNIWDPVDDKNFWEAIAEVSGTRIAADALPINLGSHFRAESVLADLPISDSLGRQIGGTGAPSSAQSDPGNPGQ